MLFFGRIEVYKGVFLILDVAEQLEQEMPGQFAWKICGTGSALENLRKQVEERKLGHLVDVTGRLVAKQDVLDAFSWAHAMIVPTTSGFNEALAMTAAESILTGRPVVLSTVVPAWELLGDAAIKAEAENVDSFVEAVRTLATSPELYERSRKATATVQGQFYDTSLELGTVLGRAITDLTS
jgi:glycosyltransferase involved in cell wall biosynthesis